MDFSDSPKVEAVRAGFLGPLVRGEIRSCFTGMTER